MRRRRIGARHPRSLLVLVLPLLLPACRSPQPPKKQPVPAAGGTARIVQFYARDPLLPRGEKSVLCYGVENAKSVRLDPPVDSVWPAVVRCIEIAPAKSTTYTLTAVGEDGKEVAQSIIVSLGAPLPKIIEVSVNALTVQRGERVTVCYEAKNAASVKVVPGQAVKNIVQTLEHGCFADFPAKTTTYTVTAASVDGVTDEERVTVKIK